MSDGYSDTISEGENDRILNWQKMRCGDDFESENDQPSRSTSKTNSIIGKNDSVGARSIGGRSSTESQSSSSASSMDFEKYRQQTRGGRATLNQNPQFTKSTVAFMQDGQRATIKNSEQSVKIDSFELEYAKKFQRNNRRRGAISKTNDDHKQAIELQALLDTERGMPCKTRNGKMSASNLAEINYRERKREALIQEKGQNLTPEAAYDMLMCKYVRLTQSNIQALKLTARFGGFDTQFHPHMTEAELGEHIEDFCDSHC